MYCTHRTNFAQEAASDVNAMLYNEKYLPIATVWADRTRPGTAKSGNAPLSPRQ